MHMSRRFRNIVNIVDFRMLKICWFEHNLKKQRWKIKEDFLENVPGPSSDFISAIASVLIEVEKRITVNLPVGTGLSVPVQVFAGIEVASAWSSCVRWTGMWAFSIHDYAFPQRTFSQRCDINSICDGWYRRLKLAKAERGQRLCPKHLQRTEFVRLACAQVYNKHSSYPASWRIKRCSDQQPCARTSILVASSACPQQYGSRSTVVSHQRITHTAHPCSSTCEIVHVQDQGLSFLHVHHAAQVVSFLRVGF